MVPEYWRWYEIKRKNVHLDSLDDIVCPAIKQALFVGEIYLVHQGYFIFNILSTICFSMKHWRAMPSGFYL